MSAIEIVKDIYWVGVNDRTTDLFEGLWPISEAGVSYNSYLIIDEKKALIDLVKTTKVDEYLTQLEGLLDLSSLDYVVINHMEPDHSGFLRMLRKISPEVTILCSAKAKEMLHSFFGLKENIRVVNEGDLLSLGEKSLKFFSTPFLHWPETIMSYETSSRVLFSCDAFGGFGAIHGAIFDDWCRDLDFYQKEALRYYVNIVANYSTRVLKAIEKLSGIEVNIIAPSHGLIWRKEVSKILSLYHKWAECASGETEPGITLIYGTMYGNTELMMNAVARGIAKEDVPVEIFDASRVHVSHILPSLWMKKGVMIGAPTYEVSLFPPVAEVLRMATRKNIKNKKAAFFGSFGWSGGALKGVREIIEPLNWELREVLEVQGAPSSDDLREAEELGVRFARLIKA